MSCVVHYTLLSFILLFFSFLCCCLSVLVVFFMSIENAKDGGETEREWEEEFGCCGLGLMLREREREREREAFPITISRPMDHLFSRAFYQDLQSSRIEDPSNDRGGLRSLLSPHALSPDRIARYNERALSHITFVALQLPRFILTTPFNILFSIS